MQSKVFGYARVSSSGQNTDRQVEALMEYGVPERDILCDYQSGKDFSRPSYQSLKNNMLRSGDVLVIKEMDRLGRNKNQIKQELEYFKEHGIRVKILEIPSTLIEVEGQDWIMEMVTNIIIEVLASIAEKEREKIHLRQAEGIAVAKEKGIPLGRLNVEVPENFETIINQVIAHQITAVAAMKQLNLKRGTFYKFKNLYEGGQL